MPFFTAAFTGTSLTTGPSNHDWQNKVAARLLPGLSKRIRFFDLGKQGETSAWGLANAAMVIRMQPDLVVIEFGINDALLAKSISLAQSETNMRALIAALQSGTPRSAVYLMTMNPVVGPVREAERPDLAQYYALYRSLASELSLGLIDNEPLWGTPTFDEIADGVHPDEPAVDAILVPSVTGSLQTFLQDHS
jgi:lysophospholipase L1-like esterase